MVTKKFSKRDLGLLGEQLACKYLIQKGYTIRERNWRHGRAEIDIIAENEGLLVFVEVKTRSDEDFIAPEESVNLRKEELITSAAAQYMHQIDYEWEFRFDIVAIVVKGGKAIRIRHYTDAFFPGLNE